ncbi:hypothetical protein TNCV_2049941 [Trichonephila clavipes]|nr:hypothetical protein TNCV_2049941 [Trichonephila clavipes]
MSGEIAESVQTCKGCQLRKPKKIGDRAPITPIVRPELPFEILNIDVTRPIQSPSGRGHKYVLCMMDQRTRTGIPSIIASDQGTNFKSALTQEFTKRIGSSPRFSCPGYPASNGLVERWNKVLKDMIHHVIREDPRSWDRQLPFLFAYREVPNTTTGVSPFRLLYGREARGPLAILKSSWAGEIHLPTNISQSAADYFQEMKINMEKAAESASLTAAQKQKAYTSTRESLKIKVDEQIEELLRLDLIEESDAEIAYPIVCVNKKDGTLRLCVDFRALNSESVSDDFPMEDAVELMHSIGRANIITTLDLLKGYWTIPMAEDSKNLTSFKTNRQQYRFKVMSFELNFTVNLKKCAFGNTQIKYLGHIIGSGKQEPYPEKTAVINHLPVPKTKKELRSVLGLCNYYREYIPKYTELVYPLTELTKKRVPDSIPWTEKHDSSFHLLKKALVEAPSLYSPVPDKPYTTHSGASQIGIAACMSQKCGDKCYPIAFVSQKLSKTQQ